MPSKNKIRKHFNQRVLKDIEKNLISKEEEEVFKKAAERLNATYDELIEQEKKEVKKPTKKTVILDSDSIDFANQSILLRAILTNNLTIKESFTDFIKKLIREEWKRLFTTYENLNNEIENERKNKN
jgi:hypothetical protein